MIEKYFELGVRFKWTKPKNVDGPRDGKVVDSIRPTAPLTYIGLGEVVSPKLMMTHVSTIGLQMRQPIAHQWLDYAPGRTARVAMGPYDVLTGFMSGCIITRWNDRGVNYVGHVGTVEADAEANRKVKRAYGFAMAKTTTGFNPFAGWLAEIPGVCGKFRPPKVPNICALVTTSGDFYSILMMNDGPDEWYCGGIRKCPAMTHDQLKMYMMRED